MQAKGVTLASRFAHIEHSRIDALSDGIFSIALTLLGFDLISVVGKTTASKDLTLALAQQWPVFFSYLLGFFVLYSIWYQYHVMGQFAGRPHALMVWQHGFGLMFATLVPFATSLLGQNLNTPNMPTAVFYFGVTIFADAPVQVLFFLAQLRNGDNPVTEDAPFSGKTYTRLGLLLMSIMSVFGLISVLIALWQPWVAIGLYSIYLASRVNPVTTFNRMLPRFERLVSDKRSS